MFSRGFCLFLFATFWRLVIALEQQKDGVCPPVLDIIILFDTSGGNDTVFEQQKNWTIKIVRDLPVHEDAVRVGIVQYSERNDIITHLETLKFMPGEDTRTGVALSKADDEIFDYDGGARLKATRLIIVFTDGLSMDKPTLAAKALRRKGVKIYTISVNSIGFVPEMLGIVGDADNVFGPTDENRIEERLLGEVESSRSCEIQPRKNEKTTSSFGWRITDAAAIVSPVTEAAVVVSDSTSESTSESISTTIASLNASFKSNESNNSVENIGHNETSTTDSSLSNVISTILPTSHTWKEPVQLFTAETESTHENKVLNLTNLKTSLSEESNTSEAKDKTGIDHESTSTETVATENSTDSVERSSVPATTETKTETPRTPTENTGASTTVSTTLPPGTTICINPPTSTPSSSSSAHFSTKSFLVKLGVKKEKKEKDPLSKFLGRDVPNGNSVKEELDLVKSKLDNSSVEKDSENSSETIETKTPTSALPTSKFLFSTKVTFRPMSTSTTTTSTTSDSTTAKSTTTSPTTTTITTTPVTNSKKSIKTEATTENTTTTTTQSPSFTPLAKSSLSLQTFSEVTAFPTLLSMEKAVSRVVTLPINNAVTALGVSKPIKKKIRRIIKRRRNILSSSKAKKVTKKVLEIKRVPTPTTPPIRSTLRPLIIEEKEEEIFSASVQCPMDILFVVDSSGSIARTYDTQKDYLTQLIKKVEPSRSHRVGLIQFAGPHIQKMEWSFDTHSKNSQLLSAIRSVRHLTDFASSNFSCPGTTYIGAALELSLILLDSRRKHTETTVILISDGSTEEDFIILKSFRFSQDDSTQQAKLLRQLPNVKMYAISLNKLTNTKYLTDIVGDRKNLFINDESQWFEEFFTKKLRCVPTTR
ncbi:Protein CBG15420 [Caenorhabditis briggsae]|uniref:Protein CBG15420 n=1 Tax=Caenorhabditis briggsae TaxID=6238 RepID=A8XMB3_CAEBR|nr:Protein CBG15420 [Caenorhabditis briggsae]CAP33788.2 Protein CBG15420 [Caenorhabditis briggsae]